MLKPSSLSYVELSEKNLIHNIKQFKNLAKKGTKFSVAIKGNAYGHGQNEVAKILEPYIDYFQVNSVLELELLRKVSNKKTFLLGYVQKIDLGRVVKLGCILAVFSLEQLREVFYIAKKMNLIQEIHIPIDAYLGREGFLLKELPKVFQEIKKSKNVKLTGMYAHFANIEDTKVFSHAQKQIDEYQKALKLGEKFGFKNLQTHISSTSGLLVYEKSRGVHPLIRLGIGAYGMWPSENIRKINKNEIKLHPILSWKTKVAQIKILPKGRTVGYGLTYKTKKETKVAVVPQGYADGLDRGLSNKGEVLIGGTRCKILGRISMNMFVTDVSHLPMIKLEDEVVILGIQGREEITVEEMAEKINTINYEITARINPLLPRTLI
ncbi:MAG TPA: alanine racemase [Candidatus Paceibacterota bacterium]|nr:alanine racemase [Candidatus Paceibacterota bacterium]